MEYKVINYIIFLLVCLSNIQAQVDLEQLIPEVSIISTNVRFIEEITTKYPSITYPGKRIGSPAVTSRTKILYRISVTIKFYKVQPECNIPLQVKLISPTGIIETIEIADNINNYNPDEFYDFEFVVNLYEVGWFSFNLGDFNEAEENLFDYKKIYVSR